jgi:hypothetical protein
MRLYLSCFGQASLAIPYLIDCAHAGVIVSTTHPRAASRKTRGRNDLVEYFSAAARIPVLNNVNVQCVLELHLDIPNAGEVYAPKTFSNRVFTQSA